MSPKIKRQIDSRPEVEELVGLLAKDGLSPALEAKVRAFLGDLADHDLEKARRDLENLSRALLASDEDAHERYPASVVITEEGAKTVVGYCEGPDPGGRCPYRAEDGRLPCGGSWLSTDGWTLQVAEDAKDCPVTVLGIHEAGEAEA